MTRAEVTPRSTAFPLGWSSQPIDGSATMLVVVEGELDRFTAPPLRDYLEWCLSCGCTRLVLDTVGVTFAGADATDLLQALGRLALDRGCTIVVAAAGLALGRLLSLVGLPAGVELQQWMADASPERGLLRPR